MVTHYPTYEAWDKWWSCERKSGIYSSEVAAENALTALVWTDQKFTRFEVYPCRYCDCFHIGHKLKRR